MRQLRQAAIALAIAHALALTSMSLVQFARAMSVLPATDPQSDPFISALSWAQILLTIIIAPVIGVLVGVSGGRALAAAALAAGAVIVALVTTPLIEGLVVPDPRYVVIPLGGAGPGGGMTTFIVVVGIVVAGGLSALEAWLAAVLASRLSRA